MNYEDISERLKWHSQKFELNFNTKQPSFKIYYNCVYWAYLGYNIGSEQNKLRPVIVTRHTQNSALCTVIPLTSKHHGDNLSYHVDLECMSSTALIEQMRTIDIKRIKSPVRSKKRTLTITSNDWNNISTEIIKLYSMKPLPSTQSPKQIEKESDGDRDEDTKSEEISENVLTNS